MMYSELLKHYTKEYEKYVEMGLSKEDALTLVEKHVKEDASIKKASPYDLINLFAGEDVWKNTFEAFNKELESLMDRVSKFMVSEEKKVSADTLSQCDSPVVEKKECDCVKKEEPKTCECAKTVKDGVTEIIANTPKHKEFRVTYPNGYYKYKMLVK
jgi:hypothetical protein